MTHLRKMMLEELERRNYTESTTRVYLYTVEDFARFFHRPPDQLGPDQVRAFTAHLFRVHKLADNTVAQRVAALRFFFTKTLKRAWPIDDTPYPKKRTQLPVILSQDEVARLIESADSAYHRTARSGGGLFAINLATGKRVWATPHPGCTDRPGGSR